MSTQLTTVEALGSMKALLGTAGMQEMFRNALADNADSFIASVLDVYSTDNRLRQCAAAQVAMEALKAATLKLPITKSLGFAYIVPYKNKQGVMIPQFQLGYKGYIQLAMRTGQYKFINTDVVYNGELKAKNKLTGEIDLSGEQQGPEIVGYFSYFQMLNGFQKTIYWTREAVTAHAKKYSKSYAKSDSPWQTEFDEMAKKTMIRMLISKFGIMSVEMQMALISDAADDVDYENRVNDEISGRANKGTVIDITPDAPEPDGQPGTPAAITEGPDF